MQFLPEVLHMRTILVTTKFAAVSVLLFLLLTITNASAQKNSPAKIGQSAVWQIPADFVSNAHKLCDSSPAADFSKCFIDQMAKAGASPEAVSFTRALFDRSKGDVGILTGFNAVGPIDIGWVTYPLRANTNHGLVLLNGNPRIVNAEDLKLLDHKGLQQSAQFHDLKEQFPKVDVWPGDRDGKTWPTSQADTDGGLQFTIGYPLINGCQACAHEGTAIFSWNFDAKGKFKGTQFIGMTQ
jgi:hypothetical protein